MLMEQLRRGGNELTEQTETLHLLGPDHVGVAERSILTLVNPSRLRRILVKLFDENEFLSPYGIRSVSRYHAELLMFSEFMVTNTEFDTCLANRIVQCLAAMPIGAAPFGCR
jgi:hypothetical protein